jgi:hypothetical protein
VFAGRRVSRGYPAPAEQKACMVYSAPQGRQGSQAWQVRRDQREQPGCRASPDLKDKPDPKAKQARRDLQALAEFQEHWD